MGRNVALTINLFILLSFLSNLNVIPVEMEAYIGYQVHNLNTCKNYTSIQEAIDDPETLDGHTILVDEGTYFEHVLLSKSLSLVGKDRDTTIVDGSSVGNVIQISAHNVSISNFTIRNAGTAMGGGYPDSCVLAANVMHVDVVNNIIANGTVGVLGYASSNMAIKQNFVYNCRLMGIHLDGNSASCEIADNLIEDSLEGIELERSGNNIVERNSLKDNNVSMVLNQCSGPNTFRSNNMSSEWYNLIVWGWSLEAFLQDLDSSNLVNNKTVCYLRNSNGITLNSSNCINLGYLAVVNCTNVIVKDVDFSSNRVGVLFAHSENCALMNVTIRGNFGPLLHGGLTLFKSNNNLIVGNSFINNSMGIGLYRSDGNVFYGNSFVSNVWDVISNFNSPFSEPNGAYSINKWDSGVEGNYWSKYFGADLDSDGVGDTPFAVTQDPATPQEFIQHDNFPLMGQFYSFEVFLPSYPRGSYYVNIVSNSTVESLGLCVWLGSPNQYLQTGQHFLLFNVSREEGSAGFFRIMIPKTILNSSLYTVLVDWNLVNVTVLQESNNTHAYLYFTYHHAETEVIIVPEFLPMIILLQVVGAILLRTLLQKRKSFG